MADAGPSAFKPCGALSLGQGVLAVCLCLALAGLPAAAEEAISVSAATDKADRLAAPPPAAVQLARMGVEDRIELAFSHPPQPEIAPWLDVPWTAPVLAAGLKPTTAIASVSADLLAASSAAAVPPLPLRRPVDPDAPSRGFADPASAFQLFALEGEEQAEETREPLGGGYLAALAPPDQAWEISPEIEAGSDAAAAISLPDAPADIPVPTPRPADVPVASLTPQTPTRPEPPPAPREAETSRPAIPDRDAPADPPEEEPRMEAQSLPQLPASLLPTRPPAD